VDQLHGNVEVEQTLDGFTRQRAGKDVATGDDAVHFGLTDLLEYRLKRGEVGMNVVNGSDAYDGIPLIGRRKSRMEKNTALVLTSFEMSKG
jgi:hypothetical protein